MLVKQQLDLSRIFSGYRLYAVKTSCPSPDFKKSLRNVSSTISLILESSSSITRSTDGFTSAKCHHIHKRDDFLYTHALVPDWYPESVPLGKEGVIILNTHWIPGGSPLHAQHFHCGRLCIGDVSGKRYQDHPGLVRPQREVEE